MRSTPRRYQTGSVSTQGVTSGSLRKKRRQSSEGASENTSQNSAKRSKSQQYSSPAQTRSKTRSIVAQSVLDSKDLSAIMPESILSGMHEFKHDGGHKVQIKIIGLFYTVQGVVFKTLLEFSEENNGCHMTKLDRKCKKLKTSPGSHHTEEIIANDINRRQITKALDAILGKQDLKNSCIGLRVAMSENPCGNPSNRCVFSVVDKFPGIFSFDRLGLASDHIHVVSRSASGDKTGWISYTELNEAVKSKKNPKKSDSLAPLAYNEIFINWQKHPIKVLIPEGQSLLSWDRVPDLNANQEQAQLVAP